MICVQSKMWNKTDDKAGYFKIGDAYKTQNEQRQHQNTLFLFSYILCAPECLCKKYTFRITKRNKNYSYRGMYGKTEILVAEKKFCDHSTKTR